jgi:hypothetical protein
MKNAILENGSSNNCAMRNPEKSRKRERRREGYEEKSLEVVPASSTRLQTGMGSPVIIDLHKDNEKKR